MTKQLKSIYVLSGMGLGIAIAAQGSLAILALGLAVGAIALVGVFLLDENR